MTNIRMNILLDGIWRRVTDPRNKFGGIRGLSGGKLIFSPLEPKICVWGISGGKLISVSPPNIKIGVLGGGN